MSRQMRQKTTAILYNDLDLVHVAYVMNEPKEEIQCNLEDLLKPPAKR